MDVELSRLLHDDKSLYVREGYGGKGIDYWPFFQFICQYLDGEEEKAKELWVEWLIGQYSKYGSLDKTLGGMSGGSVQVYALNFAGCKSPSSLNDSDIRHGAHMLVERRIEMIRSIRDEGFDVKKSGCETALKVTQNKNVYYVLKGGHHRAATLFALGYMTFPNVRTLKPVSYKVLRFGRKIVNLIKRLLYD